MNQCDMHTHMINYSCILLRQALMMSCDSARKVVLTGVAAGGDAGGGDGLPLLMVPWTLSCNHNKSSVNNQT